MTKKVRKPSDARPNQLANEVVLSAAELNAVAAGTRKSTDTSASTSGVTFLRFDFG